MPGWLRRRRGRHRVAAGRGDAARTLGRRERECAVTRAVTQVPQVTQLPLLIHRAAEMTAEATETAEGAGTGRG